MKCKNCKRDIPDQSIFCNWCGQRQLRMNSKKEQIRVPEPKILKSGKSRIQLRRENISITRDTPDECRAAAIEARRNWLMDERLGLHAAPSEKLALGIAIDNYINGRTNILSPATIKAYRSIRNNRFQFCMGWDLNESNNWQLAINAETGEVGAKTVHNAWSLIHASIVAAGITPPTVKLPRIPKADRPWLDYNQIETFLEAVRDKPCELGALLALHSLRRSELLALKPSSISAKTETLFIRGSVVLNSEGSLVYKALNKTDNSRRDVPIVIPRLKELLVGLDLKGSGYILDDYFNKLYFQINKVCRDAGLPEVGVHGLRHSFASLAYHLGWTELSTMQVGGWSNSKVVREIYTHNSDLERDIKTMKEHYNTITKTD